MENWVYGPHSIREFEGEGVCARVGNNVERSEESLREFFGGSGGTKVFRLQVLAPKLGCEGHQLARALPCPKPCRPTRLD